MDSRTVEFLITKNVDPDEMSTASFDVVAELLRRVDGNNQINIILLSLLASLPSSPSPFLWVWLRKKDTVDDQEEAAAASKITHRYNSTNPCCVVEEATPVYLQLTSIR